MNETDFDKLNALRNAGWRIVLDPSGKIRRYHPPYCNRYYDWLADAWQAYERNERCEAPLVKGKP